MTDSRLHNPLPYRARCPLHWTAVARAVGMPTETPAQPPALSPVSGGEGVNLLSCPDGKGKLSPRPACGDGVAWGQRARVRGDRAARLLSNYVTLNRFPPCTLWTPW